MEVLWAPWRIDYILGPKADSCPFCLPDSKACDEELRVLYRGKFNFVIMNIFPYSSGHLMVCPYRHIMNMADLKDEESHEMMDIMKHCTQILQNHFNPGGINVGLNIGEAAGAGIREHLHFHLVPRFAGDSSFMAVMSETRIIPQHIQSTYKALRPAFDKLG